MPKCPRCGYENRYEEQVYEQQNGPARIEVRESICQGCGVVVRREKKLLDLDPDQTTFEELGAVVSF